MQGQSKLKQNTLLDFVMQIHVVYVIGLWCTTSQITVCCIFDLSSQYLQVFKVGLGITQAEDNVGVGWVCG